ncbi:MAG: hypothetical protein J5715_00365 [Clostridiales bacterium]|nr:hypothetical protein [Clostridiales bacterium]MBO4578580.1 hypothetical protein [Clostridiales bacterium]MBR4754048.1 hypothetical protein [Lachnospiraceae bacterium]
MRQIVFKIGRFSYLLPYLVLPFVAMIFYEEELQEALLLSFFLPFAIESPVLVLFPLCWSFTVLSFVMCFIYAHKSGKRKDMVLNIVFLVILFVFATIHIAFIFLFLTNLRFTF